MQVADLLAGSLGIVLFALLCAGLVVRKPENTVDLEHLEKQARNEQKKHGFVWRN